MLWLTMVPLLVISAIGALVIVWIRWLWIRRRVPRRTLVVATSLASLPIALGMLGSTIGLIKSLGVVGGESIDPAQKARILAEGISEAMNCTALGLLIAFSFLPLGLLGLTWRYHWSKRNT